MTTLPPDPPRPGELPGDCVHPWLVVACGECGAVIDELEKDRAVPAGGSATSAEPSPAPDSQALFIVARGHPELVEELKALLGESGSVRVIEDRRHAHRTRVAERGRGAHAANGAPTQGLEGRRLAQQVLDGRAQPAGLALVPVEGPKPQRQPPGLAVSERVAVDPRDGHDATGRRGEERLVGAA